MEKLKVTKEIDEALRSALALHENKSVVLNLHAEGWSAHAHKVLNDLSMEQMAHALIVGVAVEADPHEIILQRYVEEYLKYMRKDTPYDLEHWGIRRGIEFTLQTLGITIEGIECEEKVG